MNSTLPDSHLQELEPNELVRRSLCGCQDSFGELARRFRPRLIQVLEKRLGGRIDDAEDVTQESLTRAYEKLESFNPKFRFSTWLYTIAFRIACDHYRLNKRRPPHWNDDIHAVASPSSPCRLESQEKLESIWHAAHRILGESQYTALWLRYGEDLTIAEVAQVMSKTKVGVRVLIHRARSILSKQWNEDSFR